MTETLLESASFAATLHAVSAAAAFAAALAISSAVLLNKGAKSNLSWLLIAVGLVLIGLAQGNEFLALMDLPNLGKWEDLKTFAGLLLILAGAWYWRHLLKKLVK